MEFSGPGVWPRDSAVIRRLRVWVRPSACTYQSAILTAPALRIAGGTDEILRNIIAERVLGLPGDIRVDKDVPFNKIPTKGR
jgi:alpha-beta hydrolase superfamily lysophospholipase